MYIVFRTTGTSNKNSDQYAIRNTEKKAIDQYNEWLKDNSTYTASYGPISRSQFWKVGRYHKQKNYSSWAVVCISEVDGREVFDYSIVDSNEKANKEYESQICHDHTLLCGIAPIALSTDF